MGIREPGALTKAIEQMRIDLAESSDVELRTTYADFDSLLVVVEAAREMARQELVIDWLEWSAQVGTDDPETARATAQGLLNALVALDAPFEHYMPPKDEPTSCAAISFDGNLFCDRPTGHTEDHGAKTPEGQVLWARLCRSERPSPMPDDTLVLCDRDAGHEDGHYDSAQGESW